MNHGTYVFPCQSLTVNIVILEIVRSFYSFLPIGYFLHALIPILELLLRCLNIYLLTSKQTLCYFTYSNTAIEEFSRFYFNDFLSAGYCQYDLFK